MLWTSEQFFLLLRYYYFYLKKFGWGIPKELGLTIQHSYTGAWDGFIIYIVSISYVKTIPEAKLTFLQRGFKHSKVNHSDWKGIKIMKNKQNSTSLTKGQGMNVYNMEARQILSLWDWGKKAPGPASLTENTSVMECGNVARWQWIWGVHLEWEGKSEEGNSHFPVVQNREPAVILSYIYLFAKYYFVFMPMESNL